MVRLLLISILFIFSSKVWANSCCGQSPASFPILSLEQRLNLTTSYSLTQSQGRVFNSDEFYIWADKKREVQSLKLNLASTLASGHQVFISSALLKGQYSDSLENGSAQNLSDTQLGYTFEALPEYHFSHWKPVVYLSLLANLPTGQSIYDDLKLSEGADVTGHNQWGLGVGLTLRKVYFPLTMTLQLKSLKMFSKQFSGVRVSDFYDSSIALLFNYALNFNQLILDFGLTAHQLSQRKIEPSQTTSGLIQNTTVLIGLQRAVGESWGVGVNYSDQKLIGSPKNTILNKTYTLNLSYNYF